LASVFLYGSDAKTLPSPPPSKRLSHPDRMMRFMSRKAA
jgi:hypothetical protein